jgi:hypothetical protein
MVDRTVKRQDFAAAKVQQAIDDAKKCDEYTVATLPAASTSNKGQIVSVTNGNAGAACLAYSNGTAWKVIALGATAATS